LSANKKRLQTNLETWVENLWFIRAFAKLAGKCSPAVGSLVILFEGTGILHDYAVGTTVSA
jgi:hypothetical protein